MIVILKALKKDFLPWSLSVFQKRGKFIVELFFNIKKMIMKNKSINYTNRIVIYLFANEMFTFFISNFIKMLSTH